MKLNVMRSGLFSLIPVALVLVCAACSPDRSGSGAKTSESLKQLDPASVPLYPAQREAKAKDFTVNLVSGETFQLSNKRGQVILMNIWATWCAPCHEETPDFVELYESYKDEGLLILGVSIDKQGESVVRPFLEKYDVSYPVVIDEGVIMDKYGPTMGIPTSYIIDKEGNLRYFAVGALTKAELKPRIEKLLAE